MESLFFLFVGSLAILVFAAYKLGQMYSLGKMAKYNIWSTDTSFKVIYSDEIRTILESIESVPKTYTVATYNLEQGICPGDTVRSCRNGIRIAIENWKLTLYFPTIIKVPVEG
jgi:hypothetical protein